jgi:hypothetical protein
LVFSTISEISQKGITDWETSKAKQTYKTLLQEIYFLIHNKLTDKFFLAIFLEKARSHLALAVRDRVKGTVDKIYGLGFLF